MEREREARASAEARLPWFEPLGETLLAYLEARLGVAGSLSVRAAESRIPGRVGEEPKGTDGAYGSFA